MKTYEFIGFSTELSNFLSSCTIKWGGMADLINKLLEADGYSTPADQREWKYYVNLMGEYHHTNELMTVLSLDTQDEIPFNRATLTRHPLTLAAYRAGTDYYVSLLERYPNNSDLIRCIVYPLDMEIEDIIAADDFTLVAYGSDILGSYELQPAVQTIRENLNYIRTQVYREVLSIDAYYPHTFWACMWLGLLSALYAMRTDNVKSSYMHDYYLWEYLKSYGISDYRDVLTRSQAEWLSRNINYIKKNQGTQHVLLLLANNLLSDAGMALVARIIYHHTYNNPDFLWQGEFISDALPTDYAELVDVSSVDTTTTMTTRLYTAGYEVDYSATHIEDQDRIINSTPQNILPTKVIELRPLSMFKRYSNVMARFLTDSLYRTMAESRYVPTYEKVDYTSAVSVNLTGIDILHFITYCTLKSYGQTPVYVPKYYRPLLGTKVHTIPDLDDTVMVQGKPMSLSYLIDASAIMGSSWYGMNTVYKIPYAYSTKISDLFVDVIRMIMTYQFNTQSWEKIGILYLRSQVLDTSTVYLDPHDTIPDLYADWLDANGLTSLVLTYDGKVDAATLYDNLATELFNYILPNTPVMNRYLLDNDRTATYDKLVQLMRELCSYNVLFLNGDSTTQKWIGYNPDNIHVSKNTIHGEVHLDGVGKIFVDKLAQVREHTISRTTNMVETTSHVIHTKMDIDGVPDFDILKVRQVRDLDITTVTNVNPYKNTTKKVVNIYYGSPIIRGES